MKQHFIIKNNQKHLLLFFAGWGMDETPFLTIHPTDKDWMICYEHLIPTYWKPIPRLHLSPGRWESGQLRKS